MQEEISINKLAIIIPFYKDSFIKDALYSIVNQTNQNFNLYIGNDNSPFPIKEYLETLSGDIKARTTYFKFSENMGSVSLVKQWERCINMSKYEPYIWLFSDDDIMPSDAVERFYNLIETVEKQDVFRFNVQIINENGGISRESIAHPPFETSESFIRRRLNWQCISTACEYIFSRDVYSKKGFVEFPLAWAADDATWALFAEEKGIITIPGKPVSWRMSSQNISSDTNKTYRQKIKAAILFIKLISKKFSFTDEEKFIWLQGQLYLLHPTIQKKKEFYRQILGSGLFRQSFIIAFLTKQTIFNFGKRFKRLFRFLRLENH